MARSQNATSIFMVRPAGFGNNPQTRSDNRYQHQASQADDDDEAIRAAGLEEFNRALAQLQAEGISVLVCEDTPEPRKHDAVFPNNWISTHHDGTVLTYPMKAAFRRLERQLPLLQQFNEGFRVERVLDLTLYERWERFLEGTGSLVFDHITRTVFAAKSERTDPGLAGKAAGELGYDLYCYATVLRDYHTNVIQAIGTREAILGKESLSNSSALAAFRAHFESSGRDVILINQSQVAQFSGNGLQVLDVTGTRRWILSKSGWEALDTDQQGLLSRDGKPIIIPIPTIERHGGGSIRCMMGEIFLEPR